MSLCVPEAQRRTRNIEPATDISGRDMTRHLHCNPILFFHSGTSEERGLLGYAPRHDEEVERFKGPVCRDGMANLEMIWMHLPWRTCGRVSRKWREKGY